MHCRLLIPDAFPADPAFAGPLARPRFSHLETLMARGRRHALEWESPEQWLLEAFSVERQIDWPSAPFALLGDGGEPGEAFWVHAAPVHLRADRDRVLLADASLLDIDMNEARSFTDALNAHFAPGVRFEPVTPDRWYATLASPPAEPTRALSSVIGRAVETGSASIGWHALMNEIQMLLHAYPANEAREARGLPAVTGVWLWGGGRLAKATSALRAVLSRQPLALGLAARAGVRGTYPPDSVSRWLEDGEREGVHLAVLDTLSLPASHASVERWTAALEAIEREWLEPLHLALGRGTIGMVSLHLGGESALLTSETTRADLRHFWKIRRPVARYRADQ